MVHFKDFTVAPADYEGWTYNSLSGDKFLGCCIGEGLVNLAACVSALSEAGFVGWLSIEYEGIEDPMGAVERSLQIARQYLG